MKTRVSHSIVFGIVGSMAVITFALITYLLDLKEGALQWLSYPIIITVMCIGVKKWKEQTGGFLTYGQTYLHLLVQTICYAVVMTIWTYLFVAYIAPGMVEDQLLLAEARMEEQGMAQSQIDMAMDLTRRMMTPGMMSFFALIRNILVLGIINLIVAAIMKKDPPPHQFTPPSDAPFPGSNPNFPTQQ